MRKMDLRVGLEPADNEISVFNDFIRRMLLLAVGRILFRQMRQDLDLILLIANLSFVTRPRIGNRAIDAFGETALAFLAEQAVGHHMIRRYKEPIARYQETRTEMGSFRFAVHLVFNDDF